MGVVSVLWSAAGYNGSDEGRARAVPLCEDAAGENLRKQHRTPNSLVERERANNSGVSWT